MNKPRQHPGPPPGYLTRSGVAATLDVSSARLGAAGVLELLESWQFSNGPRLFREGDVAEIAAWRKTRRGLIALGLLLPSSAGWPESLLEAVLANSEDYHGTDCPICGRAAVYDPMRPEAGTWCPEHGVVPPGDCQCRIVVEARQRQGAK